MAQVGSGASRVEIGEDDPSVRQVEGVPTAVAGVTGVTERGPVGVSTLCTSFEEYRRKFGGDVADGDVSHAARGFFIEGGQELNVVRTVHYSDVDDATTKTSTAATIDLETGVTSATSATMLGTNLAPFALANGDTLLINPNGTGNDTVTISATAAARESGAETYAIVNAQTLTVAVDLGSVQTIAFLTAEFVSIGAATAEEVAAVINAKITGAHATVTSGGTKVTITSDKKGTGSHINVTGGTANGALGFTTGDLAGTGNVADVSAVTVAEIKTIVEAGVSPSVVVTDVGGAVRISTVLTGTGASLLVAAGSTADDELGLDNATHSGGDGAAQPTLTLDAEDGSYGNDLQIRIQDASDGDSSHFDLAVLRDGVVSGNFLNLTMDPDGDRYVETVLNDADTGRPLGLTATDLGLTGTATERRPVNGTSALMSGGDDGLASLADTDFIGSEAGGTGMFALDTVEDLSTMAIPGRATSAVHNAMITYCEVHRAMSVFPVLDPPADMSATEIVTYVETTASLLGSSEFGAIYWPRVKVTNPNKAVFGNDDNIVVPPSGSILGVYARSDATGDGGVYKPPAGTEPRGQLKSIVGFETDEVLDERKRGIVFPKRINPLTTGTGKPRFIDGARTLKANGNFPYVSERRGVIFIEQSIKRGLDFARHQNNDDSLRAVCFRTVRLFLIGEMKKGAFRSRDPKTAFVVDFGKGLNPDSVIFAGQLKGKVGLATQKPAEFIFVTFSQDTRALEAEAAS